MFFFTPSNAPRKELLVKNTGALPANFLLRQAPPPAAAEASASGRGNDATMLPEDRSMWPVYTKNTDTHTYVYIYTFTCNYM